MDDGDFLEAFTVHLDRLHTGEDRAAFGSHLLGCTDCWSEVDRGRRGRALAESVRTAAPAALRGRVRGLVEAEHLDVHRAPSGPRRSSPRWLLPAGLAVGVAAALALVLTLGGGPTEPPALRRAVADFSAERLPGPQLPEQRAPDLSQLDLQPAGAGGGSYPGLDVDGYAYRDPVGRRVVLYLSDEPFPQAPGAQRLAGADGPWIVRRGDVFVLCARLPRSLLVVGEDAELVRSTAGALGVL